MKKLLSSALVATLMLGLPSMALAKGKHHNIAVSGIVTKVTTASITIQEGKKHGGQTLTFAVGEGTPVKGGTLSDLTGKHVKIIEKGPSTAKEIIVKAGKHGKKTSA